MLSVFIFAQIQRTPIRTGRGNGGSTNMSNTNMNTGNVYPNRGLTNDWTNLHQGQFRHDRHAVSATLSERSASADEVENMLHSAPTIPSRPQQRTAFEGTRMMPSNMNQSMSPDDDRMVLGTANSSKL